MSTPANSNTPSPSAPAGSGVDWDDRYVQGDTPWDRGAAHPALRDWLAKNPLTGRVLVPGCGLGHDVRALAASGAEVIGFDLSPTAIATAQSFPRTGSETYVTGDLFAPPAEWLGAFDWIFEHTCFCAIDPTLRPTYAASVFALLKPGCRLLAIFFLETGSEQGPPFGCTKAELGAFFQRFEIEVEQSDLPTFEGRENREILQVLRWVELAH